MTILEFDHPLTHNVKSRDPVGSNKDEVSQTPRDTFFSVTCRKFNYLLSRLGPLITNIRPGLLATLLNNVASTVAHKTMLHSTIETSPTVL